MITQDGKHFPADSDKFAFDAEVTSLFPDIAERSIPNYRKAHQLHAALARRSLSGAGPRILDVGASLGAFYDALTAPGGPLHNRSDFVYVAVDSSLPMVQVMQQRFAGRSNVRVIHGDISKPNCLPLDLRVQYDVVCCYYVLQFLPKPTQMPTLLRLARMVRAGGSFYLGHKVAGFGRLYDSLHEEYINWRISNGYTREEIAAKTAALKNSMWPQDEETVISALDSVFTEVAETTRFTVFSTIAAVR